MVLFEILMISVGLSLDVFAYALYKGAMLPEIRKSSLIKIGGVFTVWQMASLLLGNMITNIPMIKAPAGRAAVHWRYLSVIIFLGLGLYMICKAGRQKVVIEKMEEHVELKQIAIWACITSIDAFLAGIGFGFFQTDFLITIITVGMVTAVSVVAGLYAGYWLGCQFKNKIVILGGGILLIGGIELLIRGIN
ncbi:hypothetical protein DWX43_20745 [Clostridium sp. AF19-22AC]|uniref:Putative Mn2+ efflux pump MntP n=1 Tax=Faecalicatena orotica TaxID=1544 RepID=A0A2Y9BK21_9FIRM|nr:MULTISPECIES: manganese efflux pump [Clostridia]PWJ23072.1 putative Mn2+ efflux pump MntP [Faecalicatena orotica]RHR22894.1 hypothetical protein DWX43_20745 [Clostridium sp. AF19-22AC]SSA57808.1 Putative Mn2+ efflux pump MntP [Faecalicatena orotica]